MRILVTGGAGFIGKHLCRRLVGEGHDVWSMDYKANSQRAQHEFAVKGHDQPIWIHADVRSDHPWNDAKEMDRLYHLACHASPARYQQVPLNTVLTCVNGTKNAIKKASADRARILLASTSEIYGEPEVHPQPESYRGNVNCLGPRACYDEGKRMAECLMMDYHRQYGVDTRIARIFNTYGPGMDFDDGRVISNFVTQALKGEPLTIYGDGSQTRSFCYIDDMVEGLIRLMEYEGPECHEPHNLGNPEETTVDVVAGAIACEAIGCDYFTPFKRFPLPQDDPTRRCPDITRAKKNLGWEPRVGLSEGLKRTVEDFKRRLHGQATDTRTVPSS